MDALTFTTHSQAPFVSVMLLIMSALLWLAERRAAPASHGLKDIVPAALRIVRHLAIELLLLLCFGALALALLARGGHNGLYGISEEDPVWKEINKQWPLLTTADSLLGMQAMLRLVLLLSCAGRQAMSKAASPLAGLPAAFLLLSSICRVTVLALSPFEVYHLDGPLGGALDVMLEWAVLPLLFYVAFSALSCTRKHVLLLVAGVSVCALVASSNHYALANARAAHVDKLFMATLLLEFPAALAVLLRAWNSFLAADGDSPSFGPGATCSSASAAFAFALLASQQLLEACFFVQGLAPFFEAPAVLVRAGRPFAITWATTWLQVGCYLMAAALWWVTASPAGKQQAEDRDLAFGAPLMQV